MKTIIGSIIGITIIWYVFNTISGIGKYEGQTAEEWANEYEEAINANVELQEAIENHPQLSQAEAETIDCLRRNEDFHMKAKKYLYDNYNAGSISFEQLSSSLSTNHEIENEGKNKCYQSTE